MTLLERHPDGVEILERLTLYHLLSAIGMARHGLVGVFSMTGTPREGRHRFALDGNAWASAWSPTRFVSVDADHERLDPGSEPPDFAPDLPDDLRPLFDQALADVGGRANGVLWVADDGLDFRGDTDRFELLMLPLEDNFSAGSHNLIEFFNLQQTDLALARRLASFGASGTELDETTIGEVLGTKARTLPCIKSEADAAAQMMLPTGIAWRDPRGSAERHHDRLHRDS